MGSLNDHKNAAMPGNSSISDRELAFWANLAVDTRIRGASPLLNVPVIGAPVRPIYDDFTAADTTAVIGRVAPSGHTWSGTGAGTPVVTTNAYTSAGISYIYTDLGEPVSRIEFQTTTGGGALIVNRMTDGVLTDALHFTFPRTGWTFSLLRGNILTTGTFEHVAVGQYSAALVNPGVYNYAVTIIGDTVILEMPADPAAPTIPLVVAYHHPDIATFAGSRAMWETASPESMTTVLAQGASVGLKVPVIPQPVSGNLLTRAVSVFDVAIAGWGNAGNSTGIARVTDRTVHGAGAINWSSVAAGSSNLFTNPQITLPNGGSRWYTGRVSIQRPGASGAETGVIQIAFQNNVDAQIGTVVGPLSPMTGSWRRTMVHAWAPAAAVKAQVYMGGACDAAGRNFYADRVCLTEGLSTVFVPAAA